MDVYYANGFEDADDPAEEFDSHGGSSAIVAGEGRNGGRALRLDTITTEGDYEGIYLPDLPTVAVVMARRFPAFDDSRKTILGFREAGVAHFGLVLEPNGALSVRRAPSSGGQRIVAGTAAYTTGSGMVLPNIYVVIAFVVTIGNAGFGAWELWVNNQLIATEADATSDDTQNGGTGVVDEVRIHNGDFGDVQQISYVDDLLIADSLPPVKNVSIPSATIDGDDAVAFTRSAGAVNAANVDELGSDDDTTFNHSATPGAEDDLTIAATGLPADSVIYGVYVDAIARLDEAGARTGAVHLKSGASEAVGTAAAPDLTYARLPSLWVEDDPDTAAPFTVAGLDAIRPGYRVAA